MKKIYLSLLSISFALGISAQTLTNANHAPTVGNMYQTFQCDSLINIGAPGAGVLWDFSTIITHSSIANNYTVVATTNTSYPIPGAAVQASINNVSYYSSTSTDTKYWGGNLSVGAVAATLIYSAPSLYAAYPMSLNTSSAAAIAGSMSIPAFGQNGTFTGNSTVLADATGTMALPNGTFTNVMRVVTSQTINFTVQLGSGTVTQKNYDYFDVGTKYPLFTYSTYTLVAPVVGTSTQTIVNRTIPSTVGIKENKQNSIDLVVYPNPSSTSVNFSTESLEAKSISIIDVTGRLIEKQLLTNGKLKLDVSNYIAGTYFYNVMGTNDQTLKAGKITVNH